jgi:formate hydrogenlyase subunit 3/multisubunit Na+/H+ antiporter MnhD subunit
MAILLFGLRKLLKNFTGEIATATNIANIAIIAVIIYRVQQSSSNIIFGFYNTTSGTAYDAPMGVQLRADGFTSWFSLIVNVVIALIFAYEAVKQRNKTEGSVYISILLFITAGVNAVLVADDFLTLFLAWTIIGISMIVMIGFNKTINDLKEGAVRAYIMVGLALIFLLIAVVLSYGLFGSLSFDYISTNLTLLLSDRIQNAKLVMFLIISLLIIGFGLLANVFLLNVWMPKATENSPASVQFFAFGIISGFSILSLIRVLYSFFAPGIFPTINYPLILVIIGLITSIEGTLLFLYQIMRKDKENISLTKIITFIIITNLGLVVTGLSASSLIDNSLDSFLTIKDCLGYSAMQLINIAISSYLCYTSKERVMLIRNNSDKLIDLKGMGKQLPITTFVLVISLTSLIGLLPTFGGVNLYMIIFSLIQLEQYTIAILLIIIAIMLVVGYLMVLKFLLFDKPDREIHLSGGGFLDDLTLPNFFGLVVAIFLLVLGFIPNIIASRIVENAEFIIP